MSPGPGVTQEGINQAIRRGAEAHLKSQPRVFASPTGGVLINCSCGARVWGRNKKDAGERRRQHKARSEWHRCNQLSSGEVKPKG